MAHGKGKYGARYKSPIYHEEEKEIRYRIVVLGASQVGKTSIITQFLYDSFSSEYKETIEDMHRGQYKIEGVKLTLEILDTAGHGEFPAMRRLAIAKSDGFVLVYSMTDSSSFDEVQKLREEIISQRGKVPIVIVGNKSDICQDIPAIDKTTVESIARVDWESGFAQVSAKENLNIAGIFQECLSKFSHPWNPEVLRRRMSMHTTSHALNAIEKRNSCIIL